MLKGRSQGQTMYVNASAKGGSGAMGNYTVYVNPYLVLKSGSYTKHFYIEGQRIVSKLGDGMSDATKAKKAGADQVNYSGKYEASLDAIVRNLKFLGQDGAILTAGKSGKVPPGQILGNGGGGGGSGGGGGKDNEQFQYFFHPDHLGSTSYITDASGEVYQHLEYFAFGETFVEEHSNTHRTPFLYNGKELYEETGLYYYGARYYDARTSVFPSVDPLAENYSFQSSYAYAANNPIRFVDVNGLGPGDPPQRVTSLNYSILLRNYNKDGQSILEKPGSALGYLANTSPATNTCAIRMSEAMNLSGYRIPKSQDTPKNVRIQNGRENDSGNFVLDAASMGNYLSSIEKPTYTFNDLNSQERINDAMNTLKKLGDIKGIIVLTAGDRQEYGATGHVDLLYNDFFGDLSLHSSGWPFGGYDLDDYLEHNMKSNLSIKIWILEQDVE